MSRCGCAQSGCGCKITSGPGINVTGDGSKNDPYRIEAIGGGGGGGGGAVINDAAPSTITVYSSTKVAALLTRYNGTIQLPPPTQSIDDDIALAAAISLAGSAGRIVAQTGVYHLYTTQTIPNGVTLRGQGGGSTSTQGLTRFQCMAAAAQIKVAGGGGDIFGCFEIFGNGIATTPFFRTGGTGANARGVFNLTVTHNANGGGTNDLCLFWGAQNDYYFQCGFGYADRDIAWFDQGFGGVTFNRCEWSGTVGRYWHRYDNQIAGGVSGMPFNIIHMGTTNLEGGLTAETQVKMFAGIDITYDKAWFYTVNALSGPAIDVGSGCILNLVNPSFQSTPATKTAGTKAIQVSGTGRVTIIGRAQYLNFDKPMNIDGIAAHIFDNTPPEFYNCSTPRFTGTGGATTAQWENDSNGLRTNGAAATDITEITYNVARSAIMFERLGDGTIAYFPGTGFGGATARWGPRASALAVGVNLGAGTPVCIGAGTTTVRDATWPASAALAGALFYNTTTQTIDLCNGTTWFNPAGGATDVAPSALPSYITNRTRTGRYDPNTKTYNKKGSNTRKMTMGHDRAMVGGLFKALCIGDSLTGAAVQGASTPVTFDKLNAWPIHYGKTLDRLGIVKSGTGWVRCTDNNLGGDPRWSIVSGSWSGAGKSYLSTAGTGAVLRFTTDSAGVCASVRYYDVGNGTASVTVDINGATSGASFVTVASIAGTAQWRTVTLIPTTPLAVGDQVNVTSGTGGINLAAANVFSPTGAVVSNIGQSSSWASGTGMDRWSDYTAGTGLGWVYDTIDGTTRQVTDLSTTSGSAVVGSATAAFTFEDKGKPLHLIPQIAEQMVLPLNTYIIAVNSPSSVTLSASALRTTTGKVANIGQVPDVVHCFVGGNDLANAQSNATITSAITAIRTRYSASDFVLHVAEQPLPAFIAAATWDSFVNAMYDLADTLDCTLVDHRAALGTWAEVQAGGLAGDYAVHLAGAAYAGMGRRTGLALAS